MLTEHSLVGQKFGRWTVIKRVEDKIKSNGQKLIQYLCRCDCGNEKVVGKYFLTYNRSTSCGCYQKELAKKMLTKHGKTDTRLYNVWCSIKNRCYNPNRNRYKIYGGRGIKMCDEWKNDFTKFYEWAILNGYNSTAPKGKYTIDRIDVNKGYYPENCRWITIEEQAKNKRNNHYLTFEGKTLHIAGWSKELGIKPHLIQYRLSKGMLDEDIFLSLLKKEGE